MVTKFELKEILMSRTSTYWKKRKSRKTGMTVIVSAPGVEAVEEEGWLTICDEHGGVCSHKTRRLAEKFAPRSDEWCCYCIEEAQKKNEDNASQDEVEK